MGEVVPMILAFGMIVEFVSDLVKKILDALKVPRNGVLTYAIVLSVSIATGVYYSWQTDQSLLVYLGYTPKSVLADVLVTGLLLGAGGSAWHALLDRLRGKQPTT